MKHVKIVTHVGFCEANMSLPPSMLPTASQNVRHSNDVADASAVPATSVAAPMDSAEKSKINAFLSKLNLPMLPYPVMLQIWLLDMTQIAPPTFNYFQKPLTA